MKPTETDFRGDFSQQARRTRSAVQTLSGRAYAHLLENICSAMIPPGEFIGRRDVARRLGISLAPVNEAIMRLDAEGFVETLPRLGTRVKLSSIEDVRGELYIREALETEAARLYRGAPISAARAKLQARAQMLGDPALSRPQLIQADLALHQALVDLAGNRILAEHFRRVVTKHVFLASQDLLSNVAGWRPADRASMVSAHMELIGRLCSADALEADALIRTHIRRPRRALF